MQASPNSTYAQILNGVIHWIFTASDLPEWNPSDFTAVDITSVSPTPQVGWLYDAVSGAFTDPATLITLAEAQATQKDVIKESFDSAVALGCAVTQGFTMQSDWSDGTKLRMAYDLAIQLGQLSTDAASVRDINNVTQPVTVADVNSMSAQVGANYQTLLQKKWGYYDQIDAATTVSAVQAIVWV